MQHFSDSAQRYKKHLSKKMVTAKRKYDELDNPSALEALKQKYHDKYLDAKNELAAMENGEQLLLELEIITEPLSQEKAA
jgi:hypothetical protein